MPYPAGTTETDEEFALVAHVRSWAHDLNDCPLCQAQIRAFRAEAVSS